MDFKDQGLAAKEEQLKKEIIGIILDAEKNSERSLQANIGPSELSSSCRRKIGYRLAGIPEVNSNSDPWAAIVGTAIHAWLQKAVDRQRRPQWFTERTLLLSPYVDGHCDWYRNGMVVDFKTAGKDRMREVAKYGPPLEYQVQVHLYGYGYEQLGLPVEDVALIFFPRAGLLKDVFTWVVPYSRAVALEALAKIPDIGGELINLDILNHPERWQQIQATPSHNCGYCPWYAYHLQMIAGASDEGCPGQ